MVVAMATTTVVEERCCARWAHEEMTPQRRNDFIAAFRHAEAGDLAFRFTQTAAGVKLWPAVVAAVCLCALWPMSGK